MIVVGSCVPACSEGTISRPKDSVGYLLNPEDLTLEADGDFGICRAYNQILRRARAIQDCQAVVLMHADVQVVDRNFRAKVLKAVAAEGVALAGVVGGSGLRKLAWNGGRRRAGRVVETRGEFHFGPLEAEVDALDGLMLILAPRAFESLDFDEQNFPAFHGYDVDYCLQARNAGMRVLVTQIDLIHRTKTGLGDARAYGEAERAIERKWPQWIRPSPLRDKMYRLRKRIRWAYRRLTQAARSVDGGGHPAVPEARSDISHAPAVAEAVSVIRCPVCARSIDVSGTTQPVIVCCPECCLGITVPPPSRLVESDDIWVNTYGNSRLTRREVWFSEARKRIEWVQLYCPDGMLLEVGGGTGEFTRLASDFGFDAYGVEVSRWAAEQARNIGARMTTGLLSDWIAHYRGFLPDAICMWHVLEHVPAPVEFLKEIASIMTDRSLLFIEVPNFDSSDARRHGISWVGADPQEHCCHYSVESISKTLGMADLQAVLALPMTRRIYETEQRWRRSRAEALLAGAEWPPEDLLRIVAKRR